MSERIDYRPSDRSITDADRLREQLQISLDLINGVHKSRNYTDDFADPDSFSDQEWEEQWQDENESGSRYMPEVRSTFKPSDWGATPAVDLPVESNYFEVPLKKERIRLPSRRAVEYLLIAAGCTGIASGWGYITEIDNPYSAVASLPFIGKDDPAKKELLDKLIANCANENVGDVLYRGNVSAESSMIWNVPNADGTISPLLPTRLDPGSDAERYPKTIVEDAILTVGACDNESQPAINIRADKVIVDLSRIQSRIMLEREKVHAEGLQKERLDASVVAGAFSQETADALFAEMTSPTNVDIAVDNTLREVGKIIAASDSTYDQQIEDVSESQLIVKITEYLAAKSPGVAYSVEAINKLPESSLIGLSETPTDKLSLTDTKVTKAVIATDPNVVSS